MHVITGLGTGGSEMMLYRLLSALDRERFSPAVISLREEGPLAEKIRALGIPVKALGMRPGFANPLAQARLAGWLRAAQPALVQTWMYHADLLGGLAARWVGLPVIWGLHNNVLDRRSTKRFTFWTVKACAWFSPWLPAKIISCSAAAAESHARLGYRREKMVVIPNGFDLQAFRPDAAARASVRAELGLPDDAPLIGLVARYDPIKDHHNFVEAAAYLRQRFPEVHFLLCGEGVTWQNAELGGWIRQKGLSSSFHLLGRREDAPSLTAALDIATNSSIGESFPMPSAKRWPAACPAWSPTWAIRLTSLAKPARWCRWAIRRRWPAPGRNCWRIHRRPAAVGPGRPPADRAAFQPAGGSRGVRSGLPFGFGGQGLSLPVAAEA